MFATRMNEEKNICVSYNNNNNNNNKNSSASKILLPTRFSSMHWISCETQTSSELQIFILSKSLKKFPTACENTLTSSLFFYHPRSPPNPSLYNLLRFTLGLPLFFSCVVSEHELDISLGSPLPPPAVAAELPARTSANGIPMLLSYSHSRAATVSGSNSRA